MATYGNAGTGGVGESVENDLVGFEFTPTNGEVLNTLTARLRETTTVGAHDVKAVLVVASSGAFVAESDVLTDCTTSFAPYVFTFSDPTLSNIAYRILVYGGNGAGDIEVEGDDTTGTGYGAVDQGYPTVPNPITLNSFTFTPRMVAETDAVVGDPPPSITDVDEDDTITLEQANVEIDGTDFDTATVELRQGGFTYTPSIDSQSATAIQFDMATVGTTGPVSAPHPGAVTVAVVNGDDQEDTIAVTITDRSGSDSVLVGTPNADPDLRLDGTPDVEAGDYVMWFNVQGGVIGDVTVNDDLTFDVDEAVTAFDFQVWDSGDGTWGDAATQTIDEEEPEPEPDPVVTTGAGSSNRRRYYVEVDGQSFPVNSAQEAQQILQRARALAEREAEVEASRVEKRVKRVVKKTGAVPTLKVETPQIKVSPELKLETAEIRADIERLYKQAAEMAELRLHLAKKMAEEDEEDDELILML